MTCRPLFRFLLLGLALTFAAPATYAQDAGTETAEQKAETRAITDRTTRQLRQQSTAAAQARELEAEKESLSEQSTVQQREARQTDANRKVQTEHVTDAVRAPVDAKDAREVKAARARPATDAPEEKQPNSEPGTEQPTTDPVRANPTAISSEESRANNQAEQPAKDAAAQNSEPAPDRTTEQQTEQAAAEEPAPANAESERVPAPAAQPPRQPQINRGDSLMGGGLPPLPPAPPAQASVSTYQQNNTNKLPYEPQEFLLQSMSMAEARSAARQLRTYGGQVQSRRELAELEIVLTRFRLPPGSNVATVLQQIQKDLPDLQTASNQRYQLLADRKSWGRAKVQWPEPPAVSCIATGQVRIGMLDTAVNTSHPALQGSNITSIDFTGNRAAPSSHGTAIASLLIGNGRQQITGLLPNANLFAANVFRQRGDNIDTTTEYLLNALNWLLGQNVTVINLSLGGEHNPLLESALSTANSKGITLVAAAGNNGPNTPPVYPAAQGEVIAVTAIDAANRLYPNANRGDYIDLAAPGVDIWAASAGNNGQYHTGTSFAAPWVAAIVAAMGASELDNSENVQDLGQAGKDIQFGEGLISLANACN